eukprot:TRINITY_DN5372_c0_g1_i1.p1 TRINITY_DN5372_c0_g1~~TRINITY_DN5372_c0_g1_i1.p1  ORF type:complete len:177 (+),score=20.94 TRINITY_DN5372_c0_g1_i1:282-812(+)
MSAKMRPQSGRPSGTDGSDFSYRMTVDQRFRKAAQRRAQLYWLFIAQAACQVTGVVWAVYLILKGQRVNTTTLISIGVAIVTLFCGEIGRNRSSTFLLRLYMLASSITTAVLLLFSNIVNQSDESIAISNQYKGDPLLMYLDISRKGALVAGGVVQIITVLVIENLLTNTSLKKHS